MHRTASPLIAMILCDGGERYRGTYYHDGWLAAQGFNPAQAVPGIAACAEGGHELPWSWRKAAVANQIKLTGSVG
jgi:hypothetical protein